MPEDEPEDETARRERGERAERKRRFLAIAFFAVAAVVGGLLGNGYIGRLPHHAGYFLVPVDDDVRVPLSVKPRHTVVIVVDGLRRDAAETMMATRLLSGAGQCRVSDQGSWTVSRPVYALLSTGLEVDRNGARNNDLTVPLAAESVWQVARASGLRVAGSSHLPWFRQLFPDGFDRFNAAVMHEENIFEGGELLDFNLFHPLYVDDAGHHHGAASLAYADAVARADREVMALLAKLDLARDLVVFTADHGHTAEGGHGGAQPEIREVLACFAGVNVARRADRAPFDGRSTAPALALLTGLRFPRHMRAGEDNLDALWELAHFADTDRPYAQDRRAAIDRFREANRGALERWLGDVPGTWSRLYAREAGAQTRRRIIASALAALFFAARLAERRRRHAPVGATATFAWVAFSAVALWVAHRLVLGEFDFTVINLRETYVPGAFAAAGFGVSASIAAHRVLVRRAERLGADLVTLVGLILLVNLGHVFVYGWPLGFPLPSAAARYFPFFGAFVLVVYGVFGLLLLGGATWRERRH